MVLVSINSVTILVSPGIVELALSLFLVLEIILVPSHESLVLITSLFDLIGKLGVFLRDSDLLLQALLLIVQLAQSVLEHHSLYYLST